MAGRLDKEQRKFIWKYQEEQLKEALDDTGPSIFWTIYHIEDKFWSVVDSLKFRSAHKDENEVSDVTTMFVLRMDR